MATTTTKDSSTHSPTATPAKLPNDFKPNEPTTKGGVGADGAPDGTLSKEQVIRAANEALLALRPQPTAAECQAVFDKLTEVDSNGQPKHKFKTAKEAGDAAVADYNAMKAA